MYWVSDPHNARQLAARNKESNASIISDMFQSYVESDNIFTNEEKNNKPVFKDISVAALSKEEYKAALLLS